MFFLSVHQWLHYPGTGAADDTGCGDSEGATLNVPLAAGAGDEEHLSVFDELLGPTLTRFSPEFLLLSSGFDVHHRDPLGGMLVTGDGIVELTRRVRGWAEKLCGCRLVSLLEGCYDLKGLSSSVVRHLQIVSD